MSEPGPPAAAGGLTPEVMEELKQLGELHEQNVLTDEEFEREKAKLLGDGLSHTSSADPEQVGATSRDLERTNPWPK